MLLDIMQPQTHRWLFYRVFADVHGYHEWLLNWSAISGTFSESINIDISWNSIKLVVIYISEIESSRKLRQEIHSRNVGNLKRFNIKNASPPPWEYSRLLDVVIWGRLASLNPNLSIASLQLVNGSYQQLIQSPLVEIWKKVGIPVKIKLMTLCILFI